MLRIVSLLRTDMYSLNQLEWWLCSERNCDSTSRVIGTPDRTKARLRIMQWKRDPLRMRALRDLIGNQTSVPFSRGSDDMVIQQIAEFLTSGRLHFHEKKMEVRSAGGVSRQANDVPFPLSERRPRVPSTPPRLVDPPSFSPSVDLPAQAAALVAAAAAGMPFCLE